MKEDEKIVVKGDVNDANEYYFIVAGMCAIANKQFKLSREQIGAHLKTAYYAAKQELGMVADGGAQDMGYDGKQKDELVKDIAYLIYGIKMTADEIGYQIGDKKYYAFGNDVN